MTETNSLTRQPTKLDYAAATQFKFNITKLPKVEFFCTSVNIPGVTLGETSQDTPLKTIPIPGDELTYGSLNVDFMIDENLENYREIHGWLTGLGFPKSHAQFETFINAGSDRFPTSNATANSREAGKVDDVGFDVGAQYSDAILSILSSKNNPILEVRFRDLYPTSLSGLSYDQQAGDTSYLTGTVSFSYLIYEFANINDPRTVESTT
tara:strand:- start:334 stop:960 length:627 start_codon:yes stop_codon:yes gene_type:complete